MAPKKKSKKNTRGDNRNLQSELAVGFNRLVESLDKIEQGQKDIVKELKGDKKKPTEKPPKKQPPPKPFKMDLSGFRDVGKGWTKLSRTFQTKTLRTIGKGFTSLTGSLKSVFSAVAGEMGEMGSFMSQVFSVSISGMIGAMFSLAKQAGQLNKMVVGTFGTLKGISTDLAKTSIETGLSMSELGGGFTKFTTEFGIGMSEVSESQMKSMAITSKNIGIQSTELAHVAGMYGLIGDMTLQQSIYLAENTALLAEQQDVAPDQVMKDIAESGEEFAKFSKGGVKNFIATTIAARKLGISVKTIVGSLRGMLNLEDSMTKEMQLSVMLGKRVNFMDVRRLTLAGDTAGAFAAMRREIGDIDMNNLDVLTMEMLAEATHMTAADLTKLSKGEPLEKIKDPLISAAESTTEMAKAMKTAMDWLTPFEKEMAKLKKHFVDQGDMGMAKELIDLVKNLFPTALKMTKAFGQLVAKLAPIMGKFVDKFVVWLEKGDKIEKFGDWIGDLIDMLSVGDFGGFWDSMLEGLRPALEKTVEFIKPLLDKLFGGMPIIGDWFKGLDGKFLVKHLDKIILGFVAFKLGLIGVFLGISKMLWGLIKGPFKFFGAGSKMGNFGMAGKAGRGLLGTKNVAGGARAGGLLGKGGKLFKGFKGIGGKMLGGAGLALSAIELGTDIWDSFTKKGVKKKKAIGGAVGGALGAGIGFFLGGPVGAALGHQLGRWIGSKAGEMMATEADRSLTNLENKLTEAQDKLSEARKMENTIGDEMSLIIQEVRITFQRAAASLTEKLTEGAKLGDLTSKEASILEKIFGPDVMADQALFAEAISKFLKQDPATKFQTLLTGAQDAGDALIETARQSTAYQEAEAKIKLAKMQQDLLANETEYLQKKIAHGKEMGYDIADSKYLQSTFAMHQDPNEKNTGLRRENYMGDFIAGKKGAKLDDAYRKDLSASSRAGLMKKDLGQILLEQLGPAFKPLIQQFMVDPTANMFGKVAGTGAAGSLKSLDDLMELFETFSKTSFSGRDLEQQQIVIEGMHSLNKAITTGFTTPDPNNSNNSNQRGGLITNANVHTGELVLSRQQLTDLTVGIKEMNATLKEMQQGGIGVYKQ